MIAPHPHERPLRAAVILVSALFWLGLVLLLWTLWERYAASLSTIDVALLTGAGAIVTYMCAWLGKAGRAARLMGHAVEIGADQFPDLQQRIRACTKRLGLAETPVAYLFQLPHDILSYSLRYWGRDYLALNAEVVGALTEHQGAIDFFVGYELGRLHDRDRRFGWLLLPGRVLPLLGPAYARAKIYSYDRHGIGACRARVDAALALAVLTSGSRRWKSFNIAHFGDQSRRQDPIFAFMELVSATPYLSRRVAHLRDVATGASALAQHHPLAWAAAALVPGIAPMGIGALARTLFAAVWVPVIAIVLWHGYHQLARVGLIEPVESRFENKVVALAKASAPSAPIPPASRELATDAYALLDADLRRLGEVAHNRYRKLGGVQCEIGDISKLGLNFRASRYALSCDEPVVYTVIEPGEFETGRAAHLRSFNWKDGKFNTSLPPPTLPAEPPEPAVPRLGN